MKKIICIIFVIVTLFTLCACSGSEDVESTSATTKNYYEMSLYGEWKRENSDVVMVLTSNNFGTQKQRGLTTNIYWEADGERILIKKNQLSEEEGLPYLLEPNTLTIYNPNGTKTVYKRVK